MSEIATPRTTPVPACAHPPPCRRAITALAYVVYVTLVAFFFANVEIQIEGAHGWAESLPVTFTIENHWLLDVFWGGRRFTGYHAWVFTFMAIAFHLPLVATWSWSWRLQARALGGLMLFWVIEDALWFVLNPHFGWAELTPERAWWHPRWFLGLPVDYWQYGGIGTLLVLWSYRLLPRCWRRRGKPPADQPADGSS